MSIAGDALLIARKDLAIERQSRVLLLQIAPFAVLVLVLFAFALDNVVVRDPSRSSPGAVAASVVAAGLFWVAVLFCALLAVQRSYAIEVADGGRDALRLSSLDPAGIFAGKAIAIGVQLLVLEAILAAGLVVMFDVSFTATPSTPWLLLATCLLATVGLVTTGACYGALSAGLRVRDTLLPVLYFPVVAPLLLGAVKAWGAALAGDIADVWPWLRLLGVFCVTYAALGVLVFDQLLEDS